jgi:protein-L-isoaspartate(D-aspartate) O-methyltransferase
MMRSIRTADRWLGKSFLLLFTFSISGLLNVDPYVSKREEMVRDQIIKRGIKDEAVLSAMRKVPRHLFVSEKYRSRAYDDSPQPIGEGQTISQPYIVALMTELLELKGEEKVLEIGTGSGYQAAVLAEITKEVYSIEIIQVLHEKASETLTNLGYRNVYLKHGDGYAGWEEHSPYDAIIVTAAAPHIPQPLLSQLADGGVMVIPVEDTFLFQTLRRVRKIGDQLEIDDITPVRFVPFVLPGSERDGNQ